MKHVELGSKGCRERDTTDPIPTILSAIDRDTEANSASDEVHHQSFTFPVAVAFTLNYMMGCGFLTLPWAFSRTGFLSILVLAMVSLLSAVAANMVLESMARADAYNIDCEYEAIDTVSEHGMRSAVSSNRIQMEEIDNADEVQLENGTKNNCVQRTRNPVQSIGSKHANADSNDNKIKHKISEDISDSACEPCCSSPKSPPCDNVDDDEVPAPLQVNKRTFEIVQLCHIFLGPWAELAYMLVLCTFLLGTLWAYGTVFSNALSSHIPIPDAPSYFIYLILFGCIVVPISCMELKEQIVIQVILAFGRVLMVLCMVFSIILSVIWGNEDDFGHLHKTSELHVLNSHGLHHLLPVAVFAHIFHHSIPSISEPVIEKKSLASIFYVTLGCCFIAYSSIALTVSLFFGDDTLSSSNLNWTEYGHNSSGITYFVKRCVSTFVVIFPAVDVASAFPLNAVTLGNNLFSMVFGKFTNGYEKSKSLKIVCRLLAAVPPLVLSALVSDLGQITDYTGIAGFFIAFIFPPLLSYFSFNAMEKKGIPPQTLYSNASTSIYMSAMLLVFGSFMLISVPISLGMLSDVPSESTAVLL